MQIIAPSSVHAIYQVTNMYLEREKFAKLFIRGSKEQIDFLQKIEISWKIFSTKKLFQIFDNPFAVKKKIAFF